MAPPTGRLHGAQRGRQHIDNTQFSVRLEPGRAHTTQPRRRHQHARFIGFYPPTLQGLLGQGRSSNWKTSWQLSGSTQFTTSQNTTGNDLSIFSLSAQVFGRTSYNSENTFANIRFIVEEGFTREEGDAFRKSIDDLDLRGTTYTAASLISLAPIRGQICPNICY